MSQKTEAELKREYRAQKQLAREEWAEQMGPTPDYLDEEIATFPDNLSVGTYREKWEKAPAHLIEHDVHEGPDAMPYFEDDKHKSEVVAKASTARTKEKAVSAANLKLRYPDLWGKRGQAQVIWGLELAKDEKISLRTIQKYFKEDRDKNRKR